jgi:hypothetical protein
LDDEEIGNIISAVNSWYDSRKWPFYHLLSRYVLSKR